MAAFSQTYSAIDTFYTKNVKDVITRYDNATNYTVTCYHEGQRSYFIVSNGIVQHRFATSTPGPVVIGLQHGYIVKDVRILGSVCYFCGSYWEETGNVIYTIGGTLMKECTYQGFVGKFIMNDVVSGSGNFGTLTIQGTKSLDRMYAYSDGIVTIGVTTSGDTSCVADVHFAPKLAAPLNYSYSVSIPTIQDEMFTDLTGTAGEIALVSRFKDTTLAWYKKYFGLRSCKSSSIPLSCDNIFLYDIDSLYLGNFTSVDTVLVSSPDNADNLVVSYLDSVSAPRNRLIMVQIPYIGGKVTHVKVTPDSAVHFNRLRTMQFLPLNTTKMVAIVETMTGKSELHFFDMNPSSTNDTIIFKPGYRLQSVAFELMSSNRMKAISQGYELTSPKQLFSYSQIKSSNSNWSWLGSCCFSYYTSGMKNESVSLRPIRIDNSLNNIITKPLSTFNMHPFTATTVLKGHTCYR